MSELLTLSARMREELAGGPIAAEAEALLEGIALAARILASEILRAPLAGLTGLAGRRNIQGEDVAQLDEFAHETMSRCLSATGVVAALVSEESGEPIFVDGSAIEPAFSVYFDPLDGSSNIDVGVSIGTIFSVHRNEAPPRCSDDLLRPGRRQYLAGYAVYGSCTSLVLATGRGVTGFTLDPVVGEFFQTHPRITMPNQGKIYSANESNSARWHPGLRRFLDHLKSSDEPSRRYTARYIGSLVADFHRNLLRGGIFLYPAETAGTGKSSGKLRLMYEANPLAFIAEMAGGAASTGERPVLDVVPSELHQRVPLIIGSAEDVATALEFLSGAS